MSLAWLWGLVHVRRLWAGALLTVLSVVAAMAWFDASYSLRVAAGPARGVGSAELFPVVLAALLPAVCLPDFDARERMAGMRARMVHSLLSLMMLAIPLAVFAAWYLTVRWQVPSQRLPPVPDFFGNLLAAAVFGLVACLVVGRFAGPVTTLTAYAVGVALQQAFPQALLSMQFSTGVSWHTNWWLTAGLLLLAGAMDFGWHSTPLPDR